jgi:hypothetical protein
MVATTSSPRTAHHRLTPAEVEKYRLEGYHVYRQPVFPQAKFNGLKNCFEDILNNLEADVRPESMDVPHFQYPQLFEWLFADEVLDLVEPILGPDIALFASHFICKPKGNGKRVPWHEDSHYWQTMITPMEVVTVWLAIDPSTKENGCMYVIPRTHNTGRQGFSDYDDLKPGEAVFNIRRCGYTMRYVSTKVRQHHEKIGQWHHLYLARGKDHAGNVYGDPTKAYAEMARFRAKHGKNGH